MASSSSKHLQLARLYVGALSLPALSFLALLTGVTFSLTLPSSLLSLIPAMQSLFLVSLPQLYRAFLSWITPPCLFVLLNGIIMILTATSGRSFSSSDGAFSELQPNLAISIENAPFKQISATDLEQTLAGAEERHVVPVSRGATPASLVGIHMAPVLHLYREDAEEVELDPPKEASADGYGHDKQIVLYENTEEMPVPAAKISPQHVIIADDPSTSASACDGCDDDDDIVKGGSEPSSPCFSSVPAMKSNIRRSNSIDSAQLVDNEGASEHLSEEAFRKRVEDFIFKVNSKIRSETRVI